LIFYRDSGFTLKIYRNEADDCVPGIFMRNWIFFNPRMIAFWVFRESLLAVNGRKDTRFHYPETG